MEEAGHGAGEAGVVIEGDLVADVVGPEVRVGVVGGPGPAHQGAGEQVRVGPRGVAEGGPGAAGGRRGAGRRLAVESLGDGRKNRKAYLAVTLWWGCLGKCPP